MNTKNTTYLLGLSTILFLVSTSACVPTASRKNAKLKPGIGMDLSGGYQWVADSDEEGSTSIPHVEVDVQYAQSLSDGSAIAFQVKVPYTIVFSSLDLYYQLPEGSQGLYYGFGAELGVLNGLYGVITQFVDDSFYYSFTPRILVGNDFEEKTILLNPQIAIGIAGSTDLSAFASYVYHTGNGFDFQLHFSDEDDSHDYRKHFALVGLSLRI